MSVAAVDSWQSFLDKQLECTDEEGQELLERLIGVAEIVEHAFRDGNMKKIFAQSSKIRELITKSSPHIQNAQYRKINQDILIDLEEIIKAMSTNSASPKQIENLMKRAHKAFQATLK